MLPIYISYFAGKETKKYRALINSIAFVIGFSIIFITLAIIANRVGNTIISYTKYIKYFFGIVIIALGLNYIEILKFNIFSRFKQIKVNVRDLNVIKSLLFGILSSISMTHCIGTFLSSALLLVASEENIIRGDKIYE